MAGMRYNAGSGAVHRACERVERAGRRSNRERRRANMAGMRYNAGMGWLRLIGSLKLQVSSEECRLFYRALLQKRPIILRSLLIVATP